MTAYNPMPSQTDSTPFITATGEIVHPLYIAVDPAYHKLGTWFYIEGIGLAKAYDTGSKIKGPYRADITFMSIEFARKWGIQYRRVWRVDAERET